MKTVKTLRSRLSSFFSKPENRKRLLLIFSLLLAYLFSCYLLLLLGAEKKAHPQYPLLKAFGRMWADRKRLRLFAYPQKAFRSLSLFSLALFLLSLLVFEIGRIRRHDDPKTVLGSASWLKDLNSYNRVMNEPFGAVSHDSPRNMILSRDIYTSMNEQKIGRNVNLFAIGGPGSGKSFNIVGPNILQASASMIVTDPSGNLFSSYAGFLEGRGYKIKCINLTNMEQSNHYNPFVYVRSDKDIVSLVQTMLDNTAPPDRKTGGDPFWPDSMRLLLTAICDYLYNYAPPETRNFSEVMRLLRLARVSETEYGAVGAPSPLEEHFFEPLRRKNPDAYALAQYDSFKLAAAKTAQSVLISCVSRLQSFDLLPVRRLTETDDLELDRIGDEKMALFMITPIGDTSFNFLTSILYSQFIQMSFRYCSFEAPFGQLVRFGDGEVLKTFRATGNESAGDARAAAEAFLERAKAGTVVYNEKFRLYELRTQAGELVCFRGTKKLMDDAVERLKTGDVFPMSQMGNGGVRMPIHVRLFQDEFYSTPKIPDYDKFLSNARKYQMSAAIFLQTLSQLKEMYRDNWGNITGACANFVYLGGGLDAETTKWLAEDIIGKTTRTVMNLSFSPQSGNTSLNRQSSDLCSASELRTMPLDECVVVQTGLSAFRGKKYKASDHPNFAEAKEIEKKSGGYCFDTEKALYLYEETQDRSRNISARHGAVVLEEEEKRKQRNRDAQQRASEIERNADVNGKPLITRPQPVDPAEERTELEQKTDLSDTIDINELRWEAAGFSYAAMPGMQ